MNEITYLLAITALTGAALSVAGAIEYASVLLRLIRRRCAKRRLRQLRQVALDPSAGVIVREPTYFTPHWNALIGRAYRDLAADPHRLH